MNAHFFPFNMLQALFGYVSVRKERYCTAFFCQQARSTSAVSSNSSSQAVKPNQRALRHLSLGEASPQASMIQGPAENCSNSQVVS